MRLIDWFVPTSAKSTRSDFGRAHLVVFTHIFGPAIGTSIVVYLAVVDRSGWLQCSIVAGFIWSFWLLPFWLRRSRNLSRIPADLGTMSSTIASWPHRQHFRPFLPPCPSR